MGVVNCNRSDLVVELPNGCLMDNAANSPKFPRRSFFTDSLVGLLRFINVLGDLLLSF